MVPKTNKNLKLASKLKKKISKFLNIEEFILFGSRAGKSFNEKSDFDILIVSKDFEGISWYRRPIEIYLSWEENYPLEVLCYTPNEVIKGKERRGIISEAMNTGIEV